MCPPRAYVLPRAGEPPRARRRVHAAPCVPCVPPRACRRVRAACMAPRACLVHPSRAAARVPRACVPPCEYVPRACGRAVTSVPWLARRRVRVTTLRATVGAPRVCHRMGDAAPCGPGACRRVRAAVRAAACVPPRAAVCVPPRAVVCHVVSTMWVALEAALGSMNAWYAVVALSCECAVVAQRHPIRVRTDWARTSCLPMGLSRESSPLEVAAPSPSLPARQRVMHKSKCASFFVRDPNGPSLTCWNVFNF